MMTCATRDALVRVFAPLNAALDALLAADATFGPASPLEPPFRPFAPSDLPACGAVVANPGEGDDQPDDRPDDQPSWRRPEGG